MLFSGASYANEVDFSFFEEQFENIIDIDIRLMDYKRPQNGIGIGGDFDFSRMKILTDTVNIGLNNENSVFNSKIYIKDNFLGIKGDSAQFALRFNDENYSYVEAFEKAKLENVKLKMDSEDIGIEGAYFNFRQPLTEFTLDNFNLDCKRHPNYSKNDWEGFLSGCLNFGKITTLNKKNYIGFEFTFFPEKEGESKVEYKSKVYFLSATQKQFKLKLDNVITHVDDELDIMTGLTDLECAKDADLLDFKGNTIFPRCLNDLKLKTPQFKINWKKKNNKALTLSYPEINLNEEAIELDFKKLLLTDIDMKFDLSHSVFQCDKQGNFEDVSSASSYNLSCLNYAKVIPQSDDGKGRLNFHLNDLEVEENDLENIKHVKLGTDFTRLSILRDSLQIDSPKSELSLDDELLINLFDSSIVCEKEVDVVTPDPDKLLQDCKNSNEIHSDRILIKDALTNNYFYVKPTSYVTEPEEIKADIKFIQVTDPEDLTTIHKLQGTCERGNGSDIFNPDHILADCAQNADIEINKIVTTSREDISLNVDVLYENLFKGKVGMNPINLVSFKKPDLKDIVIKVTNGRLYFESMVKLLVGTYKVKVWANASFNADKREFVLDVTKTKIPFMVNTRGALLFIVKHFVANDLIKVEDDKIIVTL